MINFMVSLALMSLLIAILLWMATLVCLVLLNCVLTMLVLMRRTRRIRVSITCLFRTIGIRILLSTGMMWLSRLVPNVLRHGARIRLFVSRILSLMVLRLISLRLLSWTVRVIWMVSGIFRVNGGGFDLPPRDGMWPPLPPTRCFIKARDGRHANWPMYSSLCTIQVENCRTELPPVSSLEGAS